MSGIPSRPKLVDAYWTSDATITSIHQSPFDDATEAGSATHAGPATGYSSTPPPRSYVSRHSRPAHADFISINDSSPPTASTPLLRQQQASSSSSSSTISFDAITPRTKAPSFASAYSASSSQVDLNSFARDVSADESLNPITPTPLPMRQLLVLLVGQLPEPVVATVLFPFINQLISEVGVTGGDERKVGYYAGFIESLFFFAEFCMVLRWGRLSDRIGRKPVILCGLMGLTLSAACFGLSKSYLALIVSRAMAGALSGNIGVMKSAIGEITDSSNIAEGFALLPVVWSAGATIGPLIGGFLSRPHDKFPTLFAGEFWKEYPYFLPCFCAALVCLTSFMTIALFFEESLPALRPKRVFEDKEYQPLPPAGTPPKRISHRRTNSEETLVEVPPKNPTIQEILTPPVTIAVVNYGVIALLDIAFCALLPLFYSTPIEAGGMGMSPQRIGTILGLLGLLNGVIQGTFSARLQRTFGVKNVYVFGIASFFCAFATFPILNTLARRDDSPALLTVVLIVQLAMNVASNMSFGCIFLFITSAAEKNSLGATNGIAQTMASLMRMIGPASTTSLFALTMESNLMGGQLVYWILSALTGVGLCVATLLPRKVLTGL